MAVNNDCFSDLLTENKDLHSNKHRLNKVSVQAYLNSDEIALIDLIRSKRNFLSYRELLVKLCQEERDRPSADNVKKLKSSKLSTAKSVTKKTLRHDVNIFQLKITSHDVRPVIWREVLVPAGISLDELHQCIMELFGLEGFHLHEFEGIEDHDDNGKIRLTQAFKNQRSLYYRYDFGDNWEFTITKQKNVAYDPKIAYPYCTKSKGGMMIEDCGASYGYKLITDWCRKKTSATRSALVDYYGDPDVLEEYAKFKPDFFNIKSFNRTCTKYDVLAEILKNDNKTS